MDLQEIIKDYGLGRKESEFGTDKDSPHSYISNFYQPLIDLIDTPNRLLEVGVWKGASCALWKIAFPKCSVLGVDIKIKETYSEEWQRKIIRVLVKTEGIFYLMTNMNLDENN